MSFVEAIRTALDLPAPKESQDRVHDLVAKRLDTLSPGAKVRTTDYFNHAWVPDLVVTAREGEDREVFLRFQVRDQSFEDDLIHLSDRHPLFLDIASRPDENGANGEFDLEQMLASADVERDRVLVTEAQAIDTFDVGVQEHRSASKATKEVVAGGRGLIDPRAADTIVRSWREAEDAASEASTDRLRTALDGVERFLDRIASLDLESELRGKWVAAGNAAEAFPGSEDWRLRDRSPNEIAGLVASLLDHGRSIEQSQWSEIGEAISASSLGHELSRLDVVYIGGLVSDLVRCNLSRWTAQYAYVPNLKADSLTDRFEWAVGKYALALNMIRRTAYFTDIGHKWNNVKRADALPDIRDRLKDFGGKDVLGVGIETPEENVSHELRSNATRTLAEHLSPFVEGESGWRTARLQWLELRVPGSGAKAHVDFRRNVIRADESIPIGTFASLVGRYVVALHESEMQRLTDQALSPASSNGG
jgi:hypothetical protein